MSRNERGYTLVELLVAMAIGGLIMFATISMYAATTRAFEHSNAQITLQRQGTLAVDAISRQVRRASALATACAPANTTGRSLLVTVSAPSTATDLGTYCYYAGNGLNGATAGALCEAYTPVGGITRPCRDLLEGPLNDLLRRTGQSQITLVTQTNPARPGCPRHSDTPGTAIPSGQRCLAMTLASTTVGEAGFEISDGLNAMTFNTSLMLRN